MAESDLALARYLRALAESLLDEVAAALMWGAGAIVAVALTIWAVTSDFPGRLLAGAAALLVAGLYLSLRSDRLPLPDAAFRRANRPGT